MKRFALARSAFERSKLGGALSPPNSTAPPTRTPVASGVTTKPWPPNVIWCFKSNAPIRAASCWPRSVSRGGLPSVRVSWCDHAPAATTTRCALSGMPSRRCTRTASVPGSRRCASARPGDHRAARTRSPALPVEPPRIAHRMPARNEGRATAPELRPGWRSGRLSDHADVRTRAILRAGLPARFGCAQLVLALVDMQHAIAVHHVARAGPTSIRGVSTARAINAACAAVLARAIGPARAPEAPEPGCEVEHIARPDGERAQRIEQPSRRLAQGFPARRRHDVGERERTSVAAARLRGDAFAIDQQHLPPLLLPQSQRARDADDARRRSPARRIPSRSLAAASHRRHASRTRKRPRGR